MSHSPSQSHLTVFTVWHALCDECSSKPLAHVVTTGTAVLSCWHACVWPCADVGEFSWFFPCFLVPSESARAMVKQMHDWSNSRGRSQQTWLVPHTVDCQLMIVKLGGGPHTRCTGPRVSKAGPGSRRHGTHHVQLLTGGWYFFFFFNLLNGNR